jgi:catechol 2,3-dioxygenase-like lactoylglutathione lyase family enzyme
MENSLMSNGTTQTAAGPLVHISLNVRDAERSRAFYEAFFGMPAHKQRPGYANFALQSPPLKFALNEYPEGAAKGALNHLGFQVGSVEEVEAAKERLVAAGLATFDERDATCCFAKQDKVWAHDPDGNAWEIYVVTDDLLDDHEHDHRGQTLAEGAELTALSVPAAPRCCTPVASSPCCAEA